MSETYRHICGNCRKSFVTDNAWVACNDCEGLPVLARFCSEKCRTAWIEGGGPKEMGNAKVNPTQGKCWGSLVRCLGWCDKNAREGHLTCWHHRKAEFWARRLKEKRDTVTQLRERGRL